MIKSILHSKIWERWRKMILKMKKEKKVKMQTIRIRLRRIKGKDQERIKCTKSLVQTLSAY